MDLQILVLIGIVAGVLAHLCLFIHGEWHLQAAPILLLHIALYILTVSGFTRIEGSSLQVASLLTSVLFGSYVISLFASIITYRLFFHRLRGFPGPILAGSTKLWHAWKGRRAQNHLLLDRLYRNYGEDFIRTGKLSQL